MRSDQLKLGFEGVGAYQTGKINDSELLELEQQASPTCGSCSGMFTANSIWRHLASHSPAMARTSPAARSAKNWSVEAGCMIHRPIQGLC